MPHALVIMPSNATELATIVDTIEQAGYTVSIANTLFAAKQLTGRLAPTIVFAEGNLQDGDCLSLLNDSPWPKTTQIVLIGASPSVDDALQAVRAGAKDYLAYPIDYTHLKSLLDMPKDKGATKAVGEQRLVGPANDSFAFEPYGYLIGESPSMRKLYNHIERVAPTTASVMIIGASGSGKELVAQTLHEKSLREKGPYIAINCGAISKDLISSALFGHEKGSFTGALQAHQGYFEQASGGTIFLDEITETSPDLQIRLLRVLETGKVIPVGGKRQINVDVRVIAATNRDPIEAVKAGVLREDLYYRLNTFPLNVPPLCQRPGDISLLVTHFLKKLNDEYHQKIQIQQNALERLEAYRWPGNVRELKNIIQRAYILADDVITDEHIVFGKPLYMDNQTTTLNLDIGISLSEAQQRIAVATFEHNNGDPQRTADILQISIKQLEQYLGKKLSKKLIKQKDSLKATELTKSIHSRLIHRKIDYKNSKQEAIVF